MQKLIESHTHAERAEIVTVTGAMTTSADAAQSAAFPAELAPPPPQGMDHAAQTGADASAHDTSTSPLDDPQSPQTDGHLKKRQKRNKPTLSCDCCVERKTKVNPRRRPSATNPRADEPQCDRGRPQCLACLKRQSECRYSEVANLIATAE